MRTRLIITSAALALLLSCSGGKGTEGTANVFNGTGLHGHTYPGATLPFGMVQLSPDTRTEGWDGCSGYHYSDTSILGFSHTHLSGTGVADLGDFLFTPYLGEVTGPIEFSHKQEKAVPGYYSVSFPSGITAELTATTHTGVHRYTFNGPGARKILVDATHSIGGNSFEKVSLEAVSDREIQGGIVVDGWIQGRECFMDALFSEPFTTEETTPGKLLLTFKDDLKELTVAVGISFTSAEGAVANRIAETDGLGFDAIRSAAAGAWEKALGSIQVEGGPVKEFRTFFYHTFVTPNTIGDGDSRRLSTMSLWDTFRTWNPLQTIINPTLVGDIVASMMEMYRSWGTLPVWPLAYGETDCMIGYHSVAVIADAWLRGIRSFDGEEALKAMVESSNKNKANTSTLYNAYGYIPADVKGESVSQTLEFAYDDWCIARMAEDLGHKDIADEYYDRALRYRNVFDPGTGFMRGRQRDGSWVTPFDPLGSTRDFTEAVPWQYRFFVPHDVAGLTDLMGGREPMLAALDSLFTYQGRNEEVNVSYITGLMGQYAHGNEPSHNMAYLFNWLGAPSRTQEIVRTLLTDMYDPSPDGISGNEDCGQMSAWYVMSSLGLYPACPGSGEYQLVAPLFKKAEIRLPGGGTFTIKADNPRNMYISDVTLNGAELGRNYITYDEIMAGGVLEYKLSDDPDHGRDGLPAPYSLTTEPLVSTPCSSDGLSLFKGSASLEFSCRTSGAEIRYTLDGSEPTAESPLFTAPVTLDKTTTVKARAFKDGMSPSPLASFKASKADYMKPEKTFGSVLGCQYTYHLGMFRETSDVLASSTVMSGFMARPDIRKAPDEDHFGYVFTGYIDIPEDGIWSFALISDDGAVLDLDGIRVVDNDGSHSPMTSFGRIPLLKGLHPYRLVYLEDFEDQMLEIQWKAEDETRFTPIPTEKFFYR